MQLAVDELRYEVRRDSCEIVVGCPASPGGAHHRIVKRTGERVKMVGQSASCGAVIFICPFDMASSTYRRGATSCFGAASFGRPTCSFSASFRRIDLFVGDVLFRTVRVCDTNSRTF